jgi:hypothetical protein
MTAIPFKLNRNILSITVIAFAIFAGGTLALHLVAISVRDKIANGLLADFVITFPGLYYFIIVRPLQKSPKSILLVLSVCCIIAYFVLPQHQQGYLLQIRKLSILAELAIIFYAATRFNRIRTSYKTHQSYFADPIYNLRSGMASVFGDSLLVKVLSSELAILRYGVLFWKKEKPVLKESLSFSTHQESGYIAIWCILLLAVLVETIGVHLLLRKWSNTAAIVVTVLTSYALVLFIADLSAVLKRKVIISGDLIILRTGLRWRAITQLSNISSAEKINNDYHSESPYLKGGIIKSGGNLLLTFKEPVKIEKLYGPGKELHSILMNIDNVHAFINHLNTQSEG